LFHVSSYFNLPGSKSSNLCQVEEMKCFDSVSQNVIDETTDAFRTCNCLPACNTIEYDFTLQNELSTPNNSSFDKSTIEIHFSDDDFIAFRRYERFGAVTFLSNMGGLLGVFLGMSVLSIVELFYFFSLRFCCSFWRLKRLTVRN
jgi:acid-sensing ion channel, other